MLKIKTFLVIFCIPFYANSQNTWLRSYGGNGQDFLIDMEVSNETIHQSGYFTGFTNFQGTILTSNGGTDVAVLTTDSQGGIISFSSFGGGGDDRATDVETTADGGLLVSGLFSEVIDVQGQEFTAVDSSDAFVAKFDDSHELLWFSKAGGIRNEQINQAIELNDGTILVVGEFKGQCSFGNISVQSAFYEETSVYSTDGFIALLDQNGEWLWVKTLTSSGDTKALALIQSNTNQLYIAGEFSEDLTLDETHAHGSSKAGMLFEINSNGDEIWFSRFTSGNSSIKSLATDLNGNVIAAVGAVGGLTFWGQTPETFNEEYNQAAHIFLLSPNGDLLNQVAISSANTLNPSRIRSDETGNIYLAGEFRCSFSQYSEELGTAIFNSLGYNDLFVAAFNEDLNELWKRHLGGNRNDALGNIYPLDDGTVLMNGSFNSTFHFSSGPDVTTFPENFNWPENWLGFEVFPPNYYQTICEVEGYGNWLSVFTESNINAFVSSVYNPDQPLLDYFRRTDELAPCPKDIVQPFISLDVNGQYTEYLEICDYGCLTLNTAMDSTGYYAPLFNLTLSPNFIQTPTEFCQGPSAEESGDYWYSLTRIDGCESYGDTLELVVFESPDLAVITNIEGEGQPTNMGYAVALCGDMTLNFTADYSSCPECDGYWESTSNDGQLTTTSETIETFVVQNEFGCTSEAVLGIDVDQPITLTPVEAPIVLYNFEGEEQGDTLFICSGSPLEGYSPSWVQPTTEYFTSSIWTARKDGVVYWTETAPTAWNNGIPLEGSGFYEFEVVLIEQVAKNSSREQFDHQPVDAEFNIDDEEPELLLSVEQTPAFPCVGDTVFLEISGTDNWYFTNQSTTFFELSDSTGYVLGNGNVGFIGLGLGEICFSTQTIIHNIQYVPVPIIEVSPYDFICEGESVTLSTSPAAQTYQWIGVGNEPLSNDSEFEISTAGSYYCEVTASGCSMSTVPINIENYTVPEITLETSPILCQNESIFLSVETPHPEYFQWNEPLSGNAFFVEVSAAGEYSITAFGCESEVISVEIEDAIPVEITADNTTFCFGESATLSGSSDFEVYNWSTGDISPEIAVDSTQWIVLVAYDEFGCESADSVFVSQTEVSSPEYATNESCVGEDVMISSDAEGNIIWTSNADGTEIIGEGAEFLCVNCGMPSNVFIAVNENGCSSVPLQVEPNYFPSSISPNILGTDTICLGDLLFLYVEEEEGVQYEWNTPLGIIEGSQVEISETSSANLGEYSVFAFDENCQSDPTLISVQINGSVPLVVTGDNILCEGSVLTLAVSNLTNDIESFVWLTPSGIVETETLQITNVSEEHVGIYSIEVTNAACEYFIEPLSVEVQSLPTVEIGFECMGEESAAFVDDSFVSYLWSNGSAAPITIYQGEGPISVLITSAEGCEVFASAIAPDIDCVDVFPNIISPNLDGMNDVIDFSVFNAQFQQVTIFNRWGEKVQNLFAPDLIWDGRDANDQPLSEAVYYWVGDGIYGQRNGAITVVR